MRRKAFQEVRELVEEMGGVMKRVKRRAVRGGTWVICVGDLIGILPTDFQDLEDLYLYDSDGSFEIRPDARERIIRLLE